MVGILGRSRAASRIEWSRVGSDDLLSSPVNTIRRKFDLVCQYCDENHNVFFFFKMTDQFLIYI